MVPGAFHVEFPNYYRNPSGFTSEAEVDAECLRQIELVLKREPEMAAVIGEPISATPVIPSKEYWKGVKQLCEQYGALLIFDEIIMFKCLEKGLSTKTIEGNILTLRPALVITQDEMDRAIDIITEAIAEVEQGKKY